MFAFDQDQNAKDKLNRFTFSLSYARTHMPTPIKKKLLASVHKQNQAVAQMMRYPRIGKEEEGKERTTHHWFQ